MTSSTVIRRLWPAEAGLFADHMRRLDPYSRHERFGRAVDDTYLERYADNCFGAGDLVFGAFVDGVMRGAGELRSSGIIVIERPDDGAHRVAEAAFSVEEEWRRRGIGAALVERVLRAARNHGVEFVEVLFAPGNLPMRALARSLARATRVDEDTERARIRVQPPSLLSLAAEVGSDFMDMAGSAFDAQLRFATPDVKAEAPGDAPAKPPAGA
jgi:GNAT superfamily N-acetyltransferase